MGFYILQLIVGANQLKPNRSNITIFAVTKVPNHQSHWNEMDFYLLGPGRQLVVGANQPKLDRSNNIIFAVTGERS